MNNNEIKYSILIPVYNKKKYLRTCIESVLKQTYKGNYEMIFVDDCSTDGSREALDQLPSVVPNARVIKNSENQGLSNNRNILIDNARGKYVLFLDPDDSINEGLLENLEQYTNQDIDMIRYQINLINDNPKKDPERFNYPKTEEPMCGEDALKYFCESADKRYALACSFCMRRQFLMDNNVRYPKDARLHEDLAMLPVAIARANSVAITDYKGYNYVRNEDSLTRSIDNVKKDSEEYYNKSYTNQFRFLTAVHYAQLGVRESNISRDTKILFDNNMTMRVNKYNEKLMMKLNREPDKEMACDLDR